MALSAFIDESGQRSASSRSSDHFVMSAVVCRDRNVARTGDLLERIRGDLGRRPGDRLHWQNIKTHHQRLHASALLGAATYLKVVSVVVCKRFLDDALPHEHMSYLFTFRLLLERLSWLAQDEQTEIDYTLSHVRRFPLSKLREYEAKLRGLGDETTIKWTHISSEGGRLRNDRQVEQLQLADLVASATAEAFEPDRYGNTETRYLRELAPRLYRSRAAGRALTSYGLKMHPWSDAAQEAYAWVRDL